MRVVAWESWPDPGPHVSDSPFRLELLTPPGISGNRRFDRRVARIANRAREFRSSVHVCEGAAPSHGHADRGGLPTLGCPSLGQMPGPRATGRSHLPPIRKSPPSDVFRHSSLPARLHSTQQPMAETQRRRRNARWALQHPSDRATRARVMEVSKSRVR